MKEIMAQIFRESGGSEILICCQKNNLVARTLYKKLGFVEQEIDTKGKVTALFKRNGAHFQ